MRPALGNMTQNERGVSLVQFAMVFPILMMIVVVIMDFGRTSALRTVSQEGVHRSLELAITVPNLDINPNGLDPNSVEYKRLELARSKVSAFGTNFITDVGLIHTAPDATLVGKTGPRLLDIQYTEDRVIGDPITYTSKVAVLLPGECVFIPNFGSSGRTECNRETLGTTPTDPRPVEPAARLMERHPVKVVAALAADAFTPILFSQPLNLENFAYRQPIPQGPFPAFEDPGLNGAYSPPVDPADSDPLGKPDLPPEPPILCPVSWVDAIEQTVYLKTQNQDRPQRPDFENSAVSSTGNCKLVNLF